MSKEFEEQYGKKVNITYNDTTSIDYRAFDPRIDQSALFVGVTGILQNDTENFVHLIDAVSITYDPATDSIIKGKCKRTQAKDKYVAKKSILELTVEE